MSLRPRDPKIIEALQAAARRERSEYVHCLLQRARKWTKSVLRGADAGLRTVQAQRRRATCC
jgi:hypothetical protein